MFHNYCPIRCAVTQMNWLCKNYGTPCNKPFVYIELSVINHKYWDLWINKFIQNVMMELCIENGIQSLKTINFDFGIRSIYSNYHSLLPSFISLIVLVPKSVRPRPLAGPSHLQHRNILYLQQFFRWIASLLIPHSLTHSLTNRHHTQDATFGLVYYIVIMLRATYL